MEAISSPNNLFNIDLEKYETVGFHATSSCVCANIEVAGFLPDKIFTEFEHKRLITIARSKGIDTSDHEAWLSLCSVTFAKDSFTAINHIKNGFAGGQGLKNISEIIDKITTLSDEDEIDFMSMLSNRIQLIRSATSVIYAVDLSNLGSRLNLDRIQPLYYFRWNPADPLPSISEIAPSRIIAKLNVTY